MGGPVILAMALAIGGGFGDQQVARFQRLAAADVASRLAGDDKRVSVKVEPDGLAGLFGDVASATIGASAFRIDGLPLYTEPDRSQAGRIQMLRLRLRDFSIRKLHVASLEADIPECRFDFALALSKHRLRLSRSGVGTGTVRISERALADFIMAKFPEITKCTVRAYQGHVWVEGHGEFLLVSTDFACVARLGSVNKRQIVLEGAKVYFDWRRTDGPARDAVLKLLTPVVDLEKDLGLADAVDIQSVDCRDGYLVAKGATRIPLLGRG